MWYVPLTPEGVRGAFIILGSIIGLIIVKRLIEEFIEWVTEMKKLEDGVINNSEENIISILNNTDANFYEVYLFPCPKCSAPSLRVKRKKIWESHRVVGIVERDYHLLQPHFEGRKKRIAICLKCGHNRRVIRSFKTISYIPADCDDSDDMD